MFVFPAAQPIDELAGVHPDMVAHARVSLENAQNDLDFLRLGAAYFEKCSKISIDYAFMEHTANAWTVPLGSGWIDLGSWDAVWDVAQKDDSGNNCECDVILQDCHDCFVLADTRLVTQLGLNNLAVIETADGILVVEKTKSQDAKNIVSILQEQNRQEHSLH